jgi:branched-chain amino acid transport system ATP-binding protein
LSDAAGLRARELTVRYGKALAVDAITLHAEPGTITAIVGPNGAGKSSCLNALYGGVRASGEVGLDGRDLSRLSALQRARSGVALVPQGRRLFMRMSVRENLQAMARLLSLGEREVETALDRFPILRERSAQMAGVLSGGEQQMLAVTRALMGKPRALLLDEMVTGLAPLIVQQLVDTALAMAAGGAIVIAAEPTVGALRAHIARGYVLLRGRIVTEARSGEALDHAYQASIGVGASVQH